MDHSLEFSLNRLTDELATFTHAQRVAFAALCAERLVPNYERFQHHEHWGDVGALRHAMDLVWDDISGPSPTRAELQHAIDACRSAAPDSEDFAGPWTSPAIDAASAVVNTLEVCLTDSAYKAALAAQDAHATAFGFDQMRDDSNRDLSLPHVVDREKLVILLWEGEHVNRELQLQAEQLSRLRSTRDRQSDEWAQLRKELVP